MIWLYPGSFAPPTYGHLWMAERALEVVPALIIVCSRNPQKEYRLSETECATLWHTYPLPKKVEVMTYAEAKEKLKRMGIALSEIVMVRGIRDKDDLILETKIAQINHENLGIQNFLYLWTNQESREISSTAVWKSAQGIDLQVLSKMASPLVVSRILEESLGLKNLTLVAGRPASGKSTFLRELCRINPDCHWINTDDFNLKLRPLVESKFGSTDLVKVAIEREEELKKVLVKPWFNLLIAALKATPQDAHLFIEVPFALQEDKQIFRFLGGKILFFHCRREENRTRNQVRGTPEIDGFTERIPDLEQSRKIAQEHRLEMTEIPSNEELEALLKLARKSATRIKEGYPWKSCFSPQ